MHPSPPARLLAPLLGLSLLGLALGTSACPPAPDRPGDDAGVSSASPDAGGICATATPPPAGTTCAAKTHENVGVNVTFPMVGWNGTAAIDPNSGQVSIYLLLSLDVGTDGKYTGKVATCQSRTPEIPLNAVGKVALGLKPTDPANVQFEWADSKWQTIAANKTGIATGSISPTPGNTFSMDKSTTAHGIAPTSQFAHPDTSWPSSESNFTMSDLADDDMDGHPGITARNRNDMGYILPREGLGSSYPQVSFLYIALRTELAFSGTRTTCDCFSGTATMTHFDNHVVGCYASDGGTPTPTGGMDCDMSGTLFIDANRTVYNVSRDLGPSGGPAQGTFVGQELSDNATCADVLSAFSATSM